MHRRSALSVLLVLLLPLASAQVPRVMIQAYEDLPEYCVGASPPFVKEPEEDGSCSAMDLLFHKLNEAWCHHVSSCPGGKGPFSYRNPLRDVLP